MKNIYLDSSAYLSIALESNFHQELEASIKNSRIFTSKLFLIEIERTIINYARLGELTESINRLLTKIQIDISSFYQLDLVDEIIFNNQFPAFNTPRSLDLIHLRSALYFHKREKIDLFLTLDNRLKFSAEEMGLETDFLNFEE